MNKTICQNNGCTNTIDIPSIDCPYQCLPCAIKARERIARWIKLRKSYDPAADKNHALKGDKP